MKIEKQTTVSFTGYRTEKIRRSSDNPSIITEIHTELLQVIQNLYQRDFRTFLSGMARGFDLIAAEAVLQLKRQHPDIRLIAVVPYPGQAVAYDQRSLLSHGECLSQADEVLTLSMHYHAGCFHVRNDFLLENSTTLVCYYDGQPGGTKYTTAKAHRMGLEIINIYEMV